MKRAQRKRATVKPKHKHTKEYLKHYYPFLPVLISIGILLLAVFTPLTQLERRDIQGAQSAEQPSILLSTTNEARIKQGLEPLQSNDKLSDAARAKAKDMVRRNYWSHNTPEGQEPWSFIANNDYSYQKAGENLAYGFIDDSAIVPAWLNSNSHRDNVLNPDFTEVGFSTATSSNFRDEGPTKVVVAMYATPRSNSSAVTQNILGAQKQVAYVETLTGVRWLTSLLTFIIAGITVYLLASHTLAFRKVVSRTERFVTRHPIIDSTLILIVAAGVLLVRTSGVIL